jgi:hypothetical protein
VFGVGGVSEFTAEVYYTNTCIYSKTKDSSEEALMKALKIAAVALSFLLVISGCDVMYSLVGYNMFSGMDTVELPSADELASMEDDEYVDAIDDAIDSGTIGDLPEGVTQDDIVTELETIYTTSDDDALVKEAALAAAAVATQADEETVAALGGVSNLLADVAAGEDLPTDAGDVVDQIFGDVTDPVSIEDTLNDLVNAAEAYSAYMGSDGEPSVPNEDVQPALISVAVQVMLTDPGSPYNGDVAGLANAIATDTVDLTGSGLETMFSDPASIETEQPDLFKLINDAGFADLFA